MKRSQPAVLTGLLDDWPALRRWDYAYLRRHLGEKPVTVSVAEGLYDVPEDPAIWGVADRNLSSVVARPAHETMRFADALSHFQSSSTREIAPAPADIGRAPARAPAAASAVEGKVDGGGRRLRYYLEYFPMEAIRTARLHHDLRRNVSASSPPCSASSEIMHSEDVCEVQGLDSASEPATGKPVATMATSAPEPEPEPAEPGAEADPDALPTLSTDGEPGELAIADWLLPRKHLIWMGGGGTVGATHYDPYENLMAVIVGSKTFHLASPDDGPKIGAFTPMAEGTFELHPGTAGRPPTLGRSAAKVSQATSLHHYAAAVLSQPAHQQPAFPRMAEATVFSCTAHAGEVLYVPSYWWHEVHSAPGAADRPSIGVNWFCKSCSNPSPSPPSPSPSPYRALTLALPLFVTLAQAPAPPILARFYESYYQRVFPNQSWDRSLHYLMLNAPSGNPLREPFPPHAAFRGAAPTRRPPASQSAQHPKQQLEASVGTDTGATKRPLPPAAALPVPHARRTSSFAERLQQRAAAQGHRRTKPG